MSHDALVQVAPAARHGFLTAPEARACGDAAGVGPPLHEQGPSSHHHLPHFSTNLALSHPTRTHVSSTGTPAEMLTSQCFLLSYPVLMSKGTLLPCACGRFASFVLWKVCPIHLVHPWPRAIIRRGTCLAQGMVDPLCSHHIISVLSLITLFIRSARAV